VYLVLEFAAGGDLSGVMASRPHGRLPEHEVRIIFAQLAAGLQALWSRRLIHRDIKPQNVLLGTPWPAEGAVTAGGGGAAVPADTVKLGDFGFARHLAVTDMAETLCGSPLYMAPELLRFQRYDAKCDLWSVGAVLYQLIGGRAPFSGSNPMDLLRAIEAAPAPGAPPMPDGIVPSHAARSLLDGLLQRDPARRITVPELMASPFVTGVPRPAAGPAAVPPPRPAEAAWGEGGAALAGGRAEASAGAAAAAGQGGTAARARADGRHVGWRPAPGTTDKAAASDPPTPPALPPAAALADAGSPDAPGVSASALTATGSRSPPAGAPAASPGVASTRSRRRSSARLQWPRQPFRADASLAPHDAMRAIAAAARGAASTLGVFAGDPARDSDPPLGAVKLVRFRHSSPGAGGDGGSLDDNDDTGGGGSSTGSSRRSLAEAGGCVIITTEAPDAACAGEGGPGRGADGDGTASLCTLRELRPRDDRHRHGHGAGAPTPMQGSRSRHRGSVSAPGASVSASSSPSAGGSRPGGQQQQQRAPGTPPSSSAHAPDASAPDASPLPAGLTLRPRPPVAAAAAAGTAGLLPMARAAAAAADLLWARALHVPNPVCDDAASPSREGSAALAARLIPVPSALVPPLPRVRPSLLARFDDLASRAAERSARAAEAAFLASADLASAAAAAEPDPSTAAAAAATAVATATKGHAAACGRIAAASRCRREHADAARRSEGKPDVTAATSPSLAEGARPDLPPLTGAIVCAHMAAAALRAAHAQASVLACGEASNRAVRLGSWLAAAALWLAERAGDEASGLDDSQRDACAAMARAVGVGAVTTAAA